MKKLLFTFLFLLMATPAYAPQLLMFSNPTCGYCQAFLKEVKPTYHQTEYSKYLPLSVINVTDDMPDGGAAALDEKRLLPIKQTPTFVIWDGKELARLVGYAGKESFLKNLGGFMEENSESFKEPQNPPARLESPHKKPSRPEGVIDSRDIFDHTYKTPEEALKASEWFGCGGNIHYHAHEKVWMPCSME